jgi:bacillithiol biosynthesis cysteine-adding enzyme BshC
MKLKNIEHSATGFSNQLISNYIDGDESLKNFYNKKPNIKNFFKQLKEKELSFSGNKREILHKTLLKQYQNIKTLSPKVKKNLFSLKNKNTFTITTGHQLSLMMGPIYLIYKILSTINLSKKLSKYYPKYNFIPLFWMATEDHDFDEISSFNFKGKKIKWNKESSGPVGELSNVGLENVFKIFSQQLSENSNTRKLISIIKNSYLSTRNLGDATRILINEFFGHYGLLILDPNEKKLKEIFSPTIKSELSFQECHDSVNQTLKLFKKKSPKYKPQVKPREINLFFIENNSRKRIYKKSPEIFSIDKSDITFNKKQILEVLKLHPEKFSPNVLMRPIYQETILPNICYIGGGAELSYWLELSHYFKNKKVPFPIILHRNSALLINRKTSVKLKKLDIAIDELFIGRLALINKKIRQISDIDLDLSFQKQFKFLGELANKTDKTFINAVNAEMSKQIKGIDKLEKRLLKAQRIKLKDQVERLVLIHESLFPHEELQERILNFSELYEIYGQKIIDFLLKKFDPLSQKFDLLELPEKI